MITPTDTLQNLPPYIFMHLVELKRQAKDKGRDIIDLGMGNPDIPTPAHIRDALKVAVDDQSTHRYPLHEGLLAFRQAVSDFYARRFSVTTDPQKEVLALIGSKEGLGHMLFALTNPGNTIIVPSPAYPAHTYAPFLARVKTHWAPLKEENEWMLDFGAIPNKVLSKAKLMILNYPNNPTGAVVRDDAYLREALKLAKRHGFLIVYDNAYSEITFDGYTAPSILEGKDAKKYAVEFNSMSKTYSMCGWRIAYALGNDKALAYLKKFKSFLDYGVPEFIQRAAIAALTGGGEREM
ncbi:MAG: aminotransferase class I/II-fold pyridoxal phosphate-dependent enzyme, partial [Elusimicrobiota bacterium]